MQEKPSQQHRQHFTLSESAKQMLDALTAQRYPGKQRRQSQLVEDLIAEAFVKEHPMSAVTTAMYGPEPEDNSGREEIFWAEVRSHLSELEENIIESWLSNDNHPLVKAYRHVTTIVGAASVMRFSSVTAVAVAIQEHLGTILNGEAALTEQMVQLLQQSLQQLQHLVERRRKDANKATLMREEKRRLFAEVTDSRSQSELYCPSCTRAVQTHWKHCGYCGTVLSRSCSRCGTVQPHGEGLRFCYECGNELA